ncbi:MarR family protein [Nannocystis exedens]|uniref:MarR family protein n=2 Tax=Nannocystis exedens TaxID=54 RepID=A0A1I2J015_9BACT|nr:transcriptional regulator [Nannocystis exedens]SFF47789.1 MarR family protein [Nannocystis exedens]
MLFSGDRIVPDSLPEWTFMTNHAHVLFCVVQEPEIRLRDVAERVGITERAVQRIVTELEESGYITRQRSGRRNVYRVHDNLPLRHPMVKHRCVGDLLQLIVPEAVTPHVFFLLTRGFPLTAFGGAQP